MSSATRTPTRPEREAFAHALTANGFSGDMRWDRLSRAIYSTDASLYEITPLGVASPRHTEDVVALVRAAAASGVPLVPRGAGTGIAGGAVGAGVQIDFSRHMHAIGPVDPERRTVEVQPGVVLGDLNRALGAHDLTFGPNVATASRATLGGMIGNNSCGSHSLYHGRTVDHVRSLTVVLADGSVVRWQQLPTPSLQDGSWGQVPLHFRENGWPDFGEVAPLAETPHAHAALACLDQVRGDLRDEVARVYPRVLRRNGGYALDRLCASSAPNPVTILCGSEGTLGLVVSAELHLVEQPQARGLLVLHFDSHLDAVAATPALLKHEPAAVELVDHLILQAGAPQVPAAHRDAFLDGIPESILVCEFFAEDAAACDAKLKHVQGALASQQIGQPVRVVRDAAVQASVWDMRNRGFGLLMSRPGESQPHEFIEDAAVDPERLPDYIRDLDQMMEEEGVPEVAHYAHASVGVIHVRPVINLAQPSGQRQLRRIADRTLELVLRYGGSMTGEHGDGIVRSEWLARQYSPAIMGAFEKIKRTFDPLGILNPNKIVDPLPMDQRLRRPPDHASLPIQPMFDYGGHEGPGGLAAMCSGVGQCRQKQVGTMCPSYVATLDEQHTTRARANALRVALSNQGLVDGLADPALDDVMALCLSCKACKTECPTGVDLAQLKAEWLHARHQVRGATLRERFFGYAGEATRMLGRLPHLANALVGSKWMGRAIEAFTGSPAQLAPPRFADESFRSWWRRRQTESSASQQRVVYFVDTWMDHHWPAVGRAVVQLLEAAGYAVSCPELGCCGRPLVGKGFLQVARQKAEALLEQLSDGSDDPIVASEPSCMSMLLDEYPALCPGTLSERVRDRVVPVETLLQRAIAEQRIVFDGGVSRTLKLHGHCHQKALGDPSELVGLLNGVAGWSAALLNTGCCGMAGSFGREHYDVGRAVGEERLFPEVRARGTSEIVVTGFSCREQIEHHTGYTPRHALEVLAEALVTSPKSQPIRTPELLYWWSSDPSDFAGARTW